MSKFKITFALLAIGTLTACQTAPAQPVDNRNSSLTQGNVQLNLQTGVTTKADVLEDFGAPNVTTRDGTGREVWSYQRAATATQSSSNANYWTILLAGGSNKVSGLETNSRMMTLIVKFDANDVVNDFSSRSSNF